MVVAGKIFELTQPMTLAIISEKLSGYHVEETFEEGDYKFNLITEVISLETKRGAVTGTYANDSILHVFHRGTSSPLPQTVEATFSFTRVQDTTFLTVVEKKRVANFIANKLSDIIFGKIGAIVEAKSPLKRSRLFTTRTLKKQKSPSLTMLTFQTLRS